MNSDIIAQRQPQTYTNRYGCVPIEVNKQNQEVGHIWPTGSSLQIPEKIKKIDKLLARVM